MTAGSSFKTEDKLFVHAGAVEFSTAVSSPHSRGLAGIAAEADSQRARCSAVLLQERHGALRACRRPHRSAVAREVRRPRRIAAEDSAVVHHDGRAILAHDGAQRSMEESRWQLGVSVPRFVEVRLPILVRVGKDEALVPERRLQVPREARQKVPRRRFHRLVNAVIDHLEDGFTTTTRRTATRGTANG